MDKIIIKGYGKELAVFQLLVISIFLAVLPILSFLFRGIDTLTIKTAIVCLSIIVFFFLSYKKDSRQLEIDKYSITYVTSSVFHKQKPKWTFSAKRPNKIIIKKDKVRMTSQDYTDGLSITLIDNTGKMIIHKVSTPLTNKVLSDILQWIKTNDLNIIIEK